MKKLLLLIFILLIFPNNCYALNIKEYLNKPYIGVPYEQGITQNLPFILVFANSRDIFSVIKMAPIGEMIYDEFKGKYNFCILNTKIEENEKLYDAFGIDEKLPVMLVINPQTQTFYQINREYYNKRDLKEILNEMYLRIEKSKH